MGARHRARERALQCLYEWEATGRPVDKLLERFWRARPETNSQVVRFCEHLVRGTVKQVEKIDPLIDAQAPNWRLERIGAVEVNILRLGLYELLWEEETPAAVAIDEAVELAKRFGDERAGEFVNGVLDGVYRRLSVDGTAKAEPPAAELNDVDGGTGAKGESDG